MLAPFAQPSPHLRAWLPTIIQWRETARESALLGHGPRNATIFRQFARCVARNLRGARPSDLPVEQPTKIELAINLRTARAIGASIPPRCCCAPTN